MSLGSGLVEDEYEFPHCLLSYLAEDVCSLGVETAGGDGEDLDAAAAGLGGFLDVVVILGIVQVGRGVGE